LALGGDECSFLHPCHFITPGKIPWYPMNRKLCGPQNWSGRGDEEKNKFPCRESSPVIKLVASNFTV